MKPRSLMLASLIVCAPFAAGCASSIKASEYAPYEFGAITRAEPATILSQRYVKMKNWNGSNRGSARRAGVNYIIKIDRTGETLSVTQSNDVSIATGAPAWVEFGDRVRVLPR
jgi:hypothetical protein